MAPVEEELMGRTREDMEHAAVDALDATRGEGRSWFGLTANEVVKRVLDAALPDFREATLAEPAPYEKGVAALAGLNVSESWSDDAIVATVLDAVAPNWRHRPDEPVRVAPPAERSAAVAEAAVTEALRPYVDGHDVTEVADDVLAGLGKLGLLTPGDVVVQNARELGIGVLVDGLPVQPDRVHLVKPDAPDPYVQCGACKHVTTFEEVAPTDPCPQCGEDRLAAMVPVSRALEKAPAADVERRDPEPASDWSAGGLTTEAAMVAVALKMQVVQDVLNIATGLYPNVVALAVEELHERVKLEPLAVLAEELRDESEPHMCTCGDNGPGSGCVGCSSGFTDRCRFELAIRKVLGR